MQFLGPTHKSCDFGNADIDWCCMLCRQNKNLTLHGAAVDLTLLLGDHMCVPVFCVSVLNAFLNSLMPNLNEGSH